jgi:glutamate dehydrogenase (NADP+)
VLTGKGLDFGGSLAREEATGYGLLYITDEMLKQNGINIKNKTICISGAGNVAIYAAEKAMNLGAKVVTLTDSTGWIYDENGINLDAVKEIKLIKRGRLSEYKNYCPDSLYTNGRFDWSVKCDIALPCATQNEILKEDAEKLIENGVIAVAEGANMPASLEATKLFCKNNVLFLPGKASNAGGVAVSALEMSQNSMRFYWTFEEVDNKLKDIMVNIFNTLSNTAKKYATEKDYISGANIASFIKVADVMISQGQY